MSYQSGPPPQPWPAPGQQPYHPAPRPGSQPYPAAYRPGQQPYHPAPAPGPQPYPMAYRPGQPGSGPPVVIATGRADARRFVIASAVLLSLGMIAVIGGAVEAVNGRLGGLIAVGFGVVFLLIGLVPIINRKRAFRPRQLVIEPAGIRWDDPQGEPWAVGWHELAAVALCRHEAAKVGPEGLSDKVAGAAADRVLGERVLVRLELFPADAGFHQRHPELAKLWTGDRVRFQLGHNVRLLPQMDAAIRHFQPHRYLGVQRTTQGSFELR